MLVATNLKIISKSFLGALWMWIIGSLLSQAVIFIVAPEDYTQLWGFYSVMTLAFSAVGVFTLGFASLIFVQHQYVTEQLMKTWKIIPVAIVAGWLANFILLLVAFLVQGEPKQIAEQSSEWLLSSLFGSIYGLVGACFLLFTHGRESAKDAL